MKPGQNSKLRMRGRMNNGGGGGGGGGGKRHMPMRNTTYDSNGPDIRVRGNAHQVLEKYLALARDASSQGDRIAAENYYQHAEHYFRTINSQNQNQQGGQNNQQRFNNNQQRPQSTPADDHALLSGDMQQSEDGEGEGEGEGEDEGQNGQAAPINA